MPIVVTALVSMSKCEQMIALIACSWYNSSR